MSQPSPTPLETPEPVVTSDIAEYRPIAAALHDLYTRHAGVVHDVTTTKGMMYCRAARAEIRTCRTSLEAKRQEIKAPALERCRLIDADAKRITEALRAIEDPLDEQIKAEEKAAEERREAKRRADMERQAELHRMVERINAWPLSCLGSTADEIREAIARYEETGPSEPDIPPYYQEEAASAKVRALDKLREMLASRVEWEAEEVRLTAERERQAAEDERLREERQQIEAEQQRQEALRQQAVREAAAERERWTKEQAAERAESERRATEERAELDKQRVEHARIERELAEERSRIDGLAPAEPAAPSVPQEPYEPGEPFDPSEPPAPREAAEPGATVMRVRFEKLGGHYHCRVFTSPRPGATYEKRGDLVFRETEWRDIPLLMRGAEFVEETTGWP